MPFHIHFYLVSQKISFFKEQLRIFICQPHNHKIRGPDVYKLAPGSWVKLGRCNVSLADTGHGFVQRSFSSKRLQLLASKCQWVYPYIHQIQTAGGKFFAPDFSTHLNQLSQCTRLRSKIFWRCKQSSSMLIESQPPQEHSPIFMLMAQGAFYMQ